MNFLKGRDLPIQMNLLLKSSRFLWVLFFLWRYWPSQSLVRTMVIIVFLVWEANFLSVSQWKRDDVIKALVFQRSIKALWPPIQKWFFDGDLQNLCPIVASHHLWKPLRKNPVIITETKCGIIIHLIECISHLLSHPTSIRIVSGIYRQQLPCIKIKNNKNK